MKATTVSSRGRGRRRVLTTRRPPTALTFSFFSISARTSLWLLCTLSSDSSSLLADSSCRSSAPSWFFSCGDRDVGKRFQVAQSQLRGRHGLPDAAGGTSGSRQRHNTAGRYWHSTRTSFKSPSAASTCVSVLTFVVSVVNSCSRSALSSAIASSRPCRPRTTTFVSTVDCFFGASDFRPASCSWSCVFSRSNAEISAMGVRECQQLRVVMWWQIYVILREGHCVISCLGSALPVATTAPKDTRNGRTSASGLT